MADRLAENGAIQYALANPEAGSKRAALSGYIMGALNDWLRSPFPPSSRLAAPGRLRGKFFDSGIAPLAMDFTSGQYASGSAGTMAMKSFSDIITFSRTSNATITKSDGTIGYAPHNLLVNSESLDTSSWIKTGTSISANSTTSPNNTITADKIVESNTLAAHWAANYSGPTVVAGTTLTYQVNLKAAERRYAAIRMTVSTNSFGAEGVWIDLQTGTITQNTLNIICSVSDAGNGFWKIVITATASTDTSVYPGIYLRTAGTGSTGSTYQGDGVSGIYAWGAQLEIGSTATTYNPTTVKNLLGYTEAFDNAAWTKSNSFVQTNLLTYSEDFTVAGWAKTTITATANSFTAPNGYQTADTLSATGANSTALQTFTASAVPYTYSVYLYRKTGTGNIDITVDGTTWVTKTITAGWTRVDTTLTPAAGSKTAGIRIATNGDEVYAWGAQLVQGSVAGDYRRTDAAALPVYYPNHNGVVCAEKLVATTTSATHFVNQTATTVAGTTMTYSVYLKAGGYNFAIVYISGANVGRYFNLSTGSVGNTFIGAPLSESITSIGDGWYRCSITYTATASSTATVYVNASQSSSFAGDGTSGIYIFGAQLSDSASLDPYVLNAAAAPSAQAYYGARFDYDPVTLQPKGLLIEEQRVNLLLNSSLAGTNLATQNITTTAAARTLSFYGTGTVTLSGTHSATVVGTGAYPTRTTYTYTPTAGTLTLTVSGTVQYAQDELGSFATSFIPTAGASVTRAADVAVIQGSNFYSWYNQNEGSVVVNADETSTAASGNRKTLYTFTAGNFNNIIRNGIDSGTVASFNATYESAAQASLSISASYQANVFSKASTAYKVNDFYLNVNNGTASVDTAGVTPIAFFMDIGYGPQVSSGTGNTAGDFLNGHIKQISYYPQRLSNDVLKGLTA